MWKSGMCCKSQCIHSKYLEWEMCGWSTRAKIDKCPNCCRCYFYVRYVYKHIIINKRFFQASHDEKNMCEVCTHWSKPSLKLGIVAKKSHFFRKKRPNWCRLEYSSTIEKNTYVTGLSLHIYSHHCVNWWSGADRLQPMYTTEHIYYYYDKLSPIYTGHAS